MAVVTRSMHLSLNPYAFRLHVDDDVPTDIHNADFLAYNTSFRI